MKTTLLALFAAALTCSAAEPEISTSSVKTNSTAEFQVVADQFADIQILRYQAPEFDQLTLQQKKLAYYLTEAGLAGRDIFYDQKYKHNLLIRKTLEGVIRSYRGDRKAAEFEKFITYAKQVFFSNGIHHHYSNMKLKPGFPPAYLKHLIKLSSLQLIPTQGKTPDEFGEYLTPILFDEKFDAKLVDLSDNTDNVKASAVNFYEGVTEEKVEKYYADLSKKPENARLSLGLNSKVIAMNGEPVEKVWKIDGMYHAAIGRIIYWLKQAVTVAENDLQREHLEELIAYYVTGDLERFNQHCIKWVKETEGRIDVVNGFIEVYQDPMQKKGSYESVVSMKDLEATKRIAAISKEAQWFEDHSPIGPGHKKTDVVGISAKVITVLGEVGDSAPASPVGINLPNADWIREKHGSKSVMLGNIMAAYNLVKAKSPATEEFSPSPEAAARIKKYGALASILHVDMHEVIGHASGKLNPGVGTPDKTLKNYAGTLEEARADLVALYYAMDQKLVEIGVMPSREVGKAEYDSYIMAGLMTQLYRLKPGENLEQTHMRNRQLVSAWAYEKGKDDKVIERIEREGKTYFQVNDYEKLRQLFGQLLKEIQRIKSEGDYAAATKLVETYGVKVDQKLLAEVHKRYEPLKIAPYQGFIQPRLVPVIKEGQIVDVKIEYPDDFVKQMLEYGEKYGLLPVYN